MPISNSKSNIFSFNYPTNDAKSICIRQEKQIKILFSSREEQEQAKEPLNDSTARVKRLKTLQAYLNKNTNKDWSGLYVRFDSMSK